MSIVYKIVIIIIALFFNSCKNNEYPNYEYMPNMYESTGYETYAENMLFENGQAALNPVDGTIPRGHSLYQYEDSNSGYELAKNEYGGIEIDDGPWQEIVNPKNGKKIVIKDVICDAFLQQILLRPTEYDVIATMNLNGDYISDALAAMVGGIGIAPGANISDEYAVFEATHGTAPKYAGQNKVNPGSLILSAEMMLRDMGWIEAADLIMSSMDRAIGAKKVTYDFARMMSDADLVSSSGFADEMIKRM